MAINRYSKLIRNGSIKRMPNITISEKSTDYYVRYKRNSSRLDNISYDYYGDPNFDWLILLANPETADLEYNIPDNSLIRIPYPLDVVMEEYNKKIDIYNLLYGIE